VIRSVSSLNDAIQLTIPALLRPWHRRFLSYGLYSMSSAGGSVQPSAVQPPPLHTKCAACARPGDRSGRAKW
jgi:hypothetical protein